jgi:large subunit ribosomal protein L30
MAETTAANATPVTGKKLVITYVKSAIGSQVRAKRTMSALGFTKLKQTITHPDNPSVRGMLYVVAHLVAVTEIEE